MFVSNYSPTMSKMMTLALLNDRIYICIRLSNKCKHIKIYSMRVQTVTPTPL